MYKHRCSLKAKLTILKALHSFNATGQKPVQRERASQLGTIEVKKLLRNHTPKNAPLINATVQWALILGFLIIALFINKSGGKNMHFSNQ